MSRDARTDPPGPWEDPEFAPARGKSTPDPWREHPGRAVRGRFGLPTRIGTLMLLILVVGFLFDPMVGPGIVLVLMGIGLALGILAAAAALGMIGVGLFAVGDRVVAWMRRGREWPDET